MKNDGAYQDTITALELIELCRVGLTLTGGTTLFVGVVKDVGGVVVNVFAAKDIGDEFQD